MGKRLGIIAGSGEIPLLVFQEADRLGYTCMVAGLSGETEVSFPNRTGSFESFDASQIEDIIGYFKQRQTSEVIIAGKINHRKIYAIKDMNNSLSNLLASAQDMSPSSLIHVAIEFMSLKGITVLNPARFLGAVFFDAGVLSETKLSPQIQEDIDFGWNKARALADSDVGQTLVVKDRAVVAVEGMEGTDEAIKRGGRLAGAGTTVIKLSRSNQDLRVDLPAVGLSTIESLADAESGALCIEANRVAFFQKDKAVSLADAKGIAVLAKGESYG
ncbi:MAG: UDP-2,3-diacylglucosamine diphosphatase LpxI [Candidatus Aminicenantes bacterium]|jgi:hypothetical protein